MDIERRQHRSSYSKKLITQRLSALIVSSCVVIVAGCKQQTAVNVVTETIDTYSIADSFPKNETRQVTAFSKDLIKTRSIRFGYQKGGIFPIARQRGKLEPDYVRKFASVHEDGGFDRVLVGYNSSGPDGFSVVSYAASVTEKLKFLLAHRPGFVSPTLAARKLATLDHFSQGRVAVHIITGSSDVEQHRDGDWLDHDTRYRRTDEYLDIIRRVWTSAEPFDYEGEFYRLKNAFSDVKPLQKPYIPIYFGGASGAAEAVGAKHSDVYAFWGEPLAAIKQRIAQVKAAAPSGKSLRFSISLRPILGKTEEKAWERAHDILSWIRQTRADAGLKLPVGGSARSQAVGSQRLLEFAKESEIHDQRLWTPIAAATGAYGNTTALVGTPEQVAESLVDYYEAGVTTLLIRGFDPVEDALAYGREVIPLVRAEVQQRERQTAIV